MDDPRKRNLDLFFKEKRALSRHMRQCAKRMAEKAAREKLRGRLPQKACDHGLFSDARDQIDLEDLLCTKQS